MDVTKNAVWIKTVKENKKKSYNSTTDNGNKVMTFEEFIKNYVRIGPEGKNIELTPEQYAFIDWIEKCKEKGIKPLIFLNGKHRDWSKVMNNYFDGFKKYMEELL